MPSSCMNTKGRATPVHQGIPKISSEVHVRHAGRLSGLSIRSKKGTRIERLPESRYIRGAGLMKQ